MKRSKRPSVLTPAAVTTHPPLKKRKAYQPSISTDDGPVSPFRSLSRTTSFKKVNDRLPRPLHTWLSTEKLQLDKKDDSPELLSQLPNLEDDSDCLLHNISQREAYYYWYANRPPCNNCAFFGKLGREQEVTYDTKEKVLYQCEQCGHVLKKEEVLMDEIEVASTTEDDIHNENVRIPTSDEDNKRAKLFRHITTVLAALEDHLPSKNQQAKIWKDACLLTVLLGCEVRAFLPSLNVEHLSEGLKRVEADCLLCVILAAKMHLPQQELWHRILPAEKPVTAQNPDHFETSEPIANEEGQQQHQQQQAPKKMYIPWCRAQQISKFLFCSSIPPPTWGTELPLMWDYLGLHHPTIDSMIPSCLEALKNPSGGDDLKRLNSLYEALPAYIVALGYYIHLVFSCAATAGEQGGRKYVMVGYELMKQWKPVYKVELSIVLMALGDIPVTATNLAKINQSKDVYDELQYPFGVVFHQEGNHSTLRVAQILSRNEPWSTSRDTLKDFRDGAANALHKRSTFRNWSLYTLRQEQQLACRSLSQKLQREGNMEYAAVFLTKDVLLDVFNVDQSSQVANLHIPISLRREMEKQEGDLMNGRSRKLQLGAHSYHKNCKFLPKFTGRGLKFHPFAGLYPDARGSTPFEAPNWLGQHNQFYHFPAKCRNVYPAHIGDTHESRVVLSRLAPTVGSINLLSEQEVLHQCVLWNYLCLLRHRPPIFMCLFGLQAITVGQGDFQHVRPLLAQQLTLNAEHLVPNCALTPVRSPTEAFSSHVTCHSITLYNELLASEKLLSSLHHKQSSCWGGEGNPTTTQQNRLPDFTQKVALLALRLNQVLCTQYGSQRYISLAYPEGVRNEHVLPHPMHRRGDALWWLQFIQLSIAAFAEFQQKLKSNQTT